MPSHATREGKNDFDYLCRSAISRSIRSFNLVLREQSSVNAKPSVAQRLLSKVFSTSHGNRNSPFLNREALILPQRLQEFTDHVVHSAGPVGAELLSKPDFRLLVLNHSCGLQQTNPVPLFKH